MAGAAAAANEDGKVPFDAFAEAAAGLVSTRSSTSYKGPEAVQLAPDQRRALQDSFEVGRCKSNPDSPRVDPRLTPGVPRVDRAWCHDALGINDRGRMLCTAFKLCFQFRLAPLLPGVRCRQRRRGQGLMDSARHVIGCHSIHRSRVHNAFDDVASTVHQSLAAGNGGMDSAAW